MGSATQGAVPLARGGNGSDEVLQALTRAALAAYDLPPVSYVKPMGLTNNAVFEVGVSGADELSHASPSGTTRLALRVHRPGFRSVAQTRSELRVLQVLHEQLRGTGTSVPRPLVARDGELVVEVAVPDPRGGRTGANRHCDLLTWVDGRVLRPGRGLGPRATHEVGAALARIHAVGVQMQPSATLELPRWNADAMFTSASPYRPGPFQELLSSEDRRLFEHVEELTRGVFDSLARDGAEWGLIHADFILLNCHLSRRRDGWSVGVIDFDDLGWGYLLYDLCPLLGNLADFPSYATLRDAFLAGYRSVRPLPSRLEAHLPVLMAARHAAACAWLAGLHRTSGSGPPFAEHVAIRMQQMRACLALLDESVRWA